MLIYTNNWPIWVGLGMLLDIWSNVIVSVTKVLIRLKIYQVLLKTMKLADSLRLGNKEIKICENGGHTE